MIRGKSGVHGLHLPRFGRLHDCLFPSFRKEDRVANTAASSRFLPARRAGDKSQGPCHSGMGFSVRRQAGQSKDQPENLTAKTQGSQRKQWLGIVFRLTRQVSGLQMKKQREILDFLCGPWRSSRLCGKELRFLVTNKLTLDRFCED